MTMAGITRRLAEVCCGSSAALSDTQDIEADRPDSSQCHGEDQQESTDQKPVLEAGLEVLQGQAAAVWLGPAMCIGHTCTWCCCLPDSMVALNNLPPSANSELADVFVVICDLFRVDDSLLLSASAKPSQTDCIHVTAQNSVTSSGQLAPACRLTLFVGTSVKPVFDLSICN